MHSITLLNLKYKEKTMKKQKGISNSLDLRFIHPLTF